MKRILLIITAIAMMLSMSSCKNKENTKPAETKTSGKVQNTETSKTEDNNENNNQGEEANNEVEGTTVSGSSSFDFEIPEITLFTPEIVEISDARIEISSEDFKVNILQNLSPEDQTKISGLSEADIELLAEKKENFLNELISAIKNESISVKMDTVSGEMVLDASILFSVDSDEISSEGKSFLEKFIPAYASVVCKDEYKDFIKELTVEGHTDTQGSYEYNKELSENRANNVSDYILSDNINMSDAERNVFKNLVKAYGRSYDNPIKDSSGKVDMAASRRVTIGFLISID